MMAFAIRFSASEAIFGLFLKMPDFDQLFVPIDVPRRFNNLGATRLYTPLASEPDAIAPLIIEFDLADGQTYRYVSDDGGISYIPLVVHALTPSSLPGVYYVDVPSVRDPHRFTIWNESLGDYLVVYNKSVHAAAA